jgi:hypothetical protein
MNILESSRRLYVRNKIVWFVIFTLICVAGPFLISGKAFGEEGTTSRICTPNPSQELVCWSAHKYAKKFRAGYFHRAHGVSASRVFKAPVKARAVWYHKIDHYLDNHPKQKASLRHRLGARTASRGGCSLVCEAYRMVMIKSSCVSHARNPSTARDVCNRIGTLDPIGKEDIQRAGAVTFCGGAIILGVAGAPESAGGTTFIAAWGAASCGWSFWSSF